MSYGKVGQDTLGGICRVQKMIQAMESVEMTLVFSLVDGYNWWDLGIESMQGLVLAFGYVRIWTGNMAFEVHDIGMAG